MTSPPETSDYWISAHGLSRVCLVAAHSSPSKSTSLDDFATDPHAAKYRSELARHPAAARRLVEILNDRANEQRLVDAEMHGLPALAGVVRFAESDDEIARVLAQGPKSYRFRQAVGVAVKLKMARLGWKTTGRKGTVRGARHFTKAEHYEPMTELSDVERAMAALDAVAHIGDDDERAATGRDLIAAIGDTRQREGRVL